MFRPNGNFRVRWDLFVMVLATWNCFSIPITVAFEPAFAETLVMFILNSCIDIFFLLDIFINFRTSFIHPNTGEEIMQFHLIAF